MLERTMDMAKGLWREILPQLGVPAVFLNGKNQACPLCGGKDRACFDDRFRNGDYFCHQCGHGTGMKLVMLMNGWDFATAAKRVDELIGNTKPKPSQPEITKDNKPWLRKLWKSSRPVEVGDPVSNWLVNRGLTHTVPRSLRYVPKMSYGTEGVQHPGMIAIFSDAAGKPFTLHRTYLTADGAKAAVEGVRKLMPGRVAKGGAIRLFQADENTLELGIAEGIETALAAWSLFGIPVWAAVNEGLLQAWEPPPTVRRVIVFGDNDANFVGQSAAYALARRLVVMKKLDVEVRIPEMVGFDWNDELNQSGSQT